MTEPARMLVWADRNQESMVERSLETGLVGIRSIGSPDDHAGRDLSDRFAASTHLVCEALAEQARLLTEAACVATAQP